MGSLQGFEKGFVNSKVASHHVISDSGNGGLGLNKFGKNVDKTHVGLASNTKASVNPTSDESQNGRAFEGNGDESMTPSTKGGASGDGPTPGFIGSGTGIAQLNGAQGNHSDRQMPT